jgi:predicted Zn-dependent peptidase
VRRAQAVVVAAVAAALAAVGCASTPPAPAPATAAATAPAAGQAQAPAPARPPARVTPDAPFRQQAPAPGPEPSFRVPAFKRFKLKNGLTVVLAELHDLPLVNLGLVVKSGGGANPPGEAGLADMTARMLTEGTTHRTAPEIADQTAALGATLAATSSWDATTVALSTLTRNLDPALAIFADVALNPAFDPKELARVRDNQLTAITRRKDSPPTVASLAMARLLYGQKHPYGWPMTGAESTVAKLTPAGLRAFYDANYRPNNAVLIVTGDVTEAAVRPKLEAAFKAWRPKPVAVRRLPAPASAAAKTRIFLIDKADAPQSSIRVGNIGIERTNPDYFPVMLMNMVLGGGFYRLDLNLREGKGWTYGARSNFESRKTPGPFAAGGEFVAPHTAESVAEIMKEINTIRDTDVTDAELSRAKDQIIKSFPARFATRGSIAGQLAELAVFGLPDSYLTDYTKRVAAVTKDDVRRVARKYLTPDRLTIVVVGDQKSLRVPLEKLAPVEARDLEGEPIAAPAPAAPTAAGGAPAGKESAGRE